MRLKLGSTKIPL